MTLKQYLYDSNARELILASKSETRFELLSAAGLKFTVQTSQIDEDLIKESLQAEGATATDQSVLLAKFKAERVSGQFPQALVIGADQILECEEKVYSKEKNREMVRAQLQNLRGKRHQLITGMVIALEGKEIWRNVDAASLTMRPFSDVFLDQYLDVLGERAFSSVGAYHIESIGIQLFSSVLGDWTTIKGLTILPLINFLREHEVVIT